MNTYRSLWLALCVPLASVGATVAIIRSPVPVALLFLVFGAVGGLLTVSSVDAFWEQPTSGRLLLAAGGGFVAGTSIGAFIGYASLLGPGVFMLAAALAAGSPYSVRACARWIRSRHDHAANRVGNQAVRLDGLTDEQVCLRWRAGYGAGRRPASTVALTALAAERQRCLDELEHRHASGLAAWLASGPGAAESPLPYLTGEHHHDVPAVDWDALTRRQP